MLEDSLWESKRVQWKEEEEVSILKTSKTYQVLWNDMLNPHNNCLPYVYCMCINRHT